MTAGAAEQTSFETRPGYRRAAPQSLTGNEPRFPNTMGLPRHSRKSGNPGPHALQFTDSEPHYQCKRLEA